MRFKKFLPFTGQDWQLINRSSNYMLPYKGRFSIAFFCMVLGIGFGLVQPYCFGKIVASVVEQNKNIFLLMILIIVIAHILKTLVALLQQYLLNRINLNIVYTIQKDMFSRIMQMPLAFFTKMKMGEFQSRIIGDAGKLSEIITNQFLSSIINILKVLIIGFAAFSISWKLFLIVLISFPCSLLVFILFGRYLRGINKKFIPLRDNFFCIINEILSGIKEIKALFLSRQKTDEFLVQAARLRDNQLRLMNGQVLMESCAGFIGFVMELLVLFAGFFLILQGELKIESYVAFISYATQFLGAMMGVTQLSARLQEALVAIGRIFDVIDSFNTPGEKFGKQEESFQDKNIVFKNVSFTYNGQKSCLENISLQIEPRKITAVVGSSGSGKSTLFNLLLRFYDPGEGCICIADHDLRDFTEQTLRRNIALVQQEPFLFSTTVAGNLRLVKPSATQEELERVCRQAEIHDYISGLPEGYHAPIGERGVNLSGGQKQRLAIARALLEESPLILLDEATSTLDNEAQHRIKSVIHNLSHKYTVVIIAHRLFTVIDADWIYVLEEGRIMGMGKHAALLTGNSLYRNLYQREIDALK